MRTKGIIIALILLLALGGFLYIRQATRGVTLDLDEGIRACGFTGAPVASALSGEEITFEETELTLLAGRRVVFSGNVERIQCDRDARGRRGFPGGDAILVALADAPLEATTARWNHICRQLGARQEELRRLDQWAEEVTQAERAGRDSQEMWLQQSCSIPGTDIGVYVQSLPTGSSSSRVYDSHFTLFWQEADATP
jgi:hypothetical protein